MLPKHCVGLSGSGLTVCKDSRIESSYHVTDAIFDEFVEISLLGPLTEHFVVLALNQMLPIGNSDPLKTIRANCWEVDNFFFGVLLGQQWPHTNTHLDAFTIVSPGGRGHFLLSEGRHSIL